MLKNTFYFSSKHVCDFKLKLSSFHMWESHEFHIKVLTAFKAHFIETQCKLLNARVESQNMSTLSPRKFHCPLKSFKSRLLKIQFVVKTDKPTYACNTYMYRAALRSIRCCSLLGKGVILEEISS